MNIDLVMDIIDLAMSLAESVLHKTPLTTSTPTAALLQIIQKAAQAYQQHTGAPLDPSLIQSEDGV